MTSTKLARTATTPVEVTMDVPDPALQPLIELSRLYFGHLREVANTPSGARAPAIKAVEFNAPTPADVVAELKNLYQRLAPEDLVVLKLPNGLPASGGSQRDVLTRALFQAGFGRPLVWAGRSILLAENDASIFNRFLSSSALGAGPSRSLARRIGRQIADRELIAIAARGAQAMPDNRALRLSVVMPVYNEKTTIRDVLGRLLEKQIPGFEIEICIVESNSSDGTREEVLTFKDHPRVRLLLEERPRGKGHAVRNGLALATGDIILIQDADLEYDLEDYEKLLAPLTTGSASFVLGSRHPAGNSGWQLREFDDQSALSDVLNLGHLFFAQFLNFVFRQSLRDPFTMYKVFRRDCIHNIQFECNRFDFDFELVGKLVRNGFRPIEIDVHYRSRSFREGKKVSFFRDPPSWIRACLLHRFSRLHIWPA